MLKKVNININSGYVWGKGHTKEQNEIFESEIKRILTNIGFKKWHKRLQSAAWEGVKDDQEALYCHPMDLVGYVDFKETLPIIERELIKSKIIEFRTTYIRDMKKKDWIYLKEKLLI